MLIVRTPDQVSTHLVGIGGVCSVSEIIVIIIMSRPDATNYCVRRKRHVTHSPFADVIRSGIVVNSPLVPPALLEGTGLPVINMRTVADLARDKVRPH